MKKGDKKDREKDREGQVAPSGEKSRSRKNIEGVQ